MEYKEVFLEYIDIVLVGIVVVFLVFSLRRLLGKKVGYQKPEQTAEVVLEKPTFTLKNNTPEKETISNKYPVGSLAHKVASISEKDPNFTQKKFIESAKKAFDMIVVSYAKGDVEKLKPFVSDAVYDYYLKSVTEGAKKYFVQVQDFLIADIQDVEMKEDGLARIKVKFFTKQIREEYKEEGIAPSLDGVKPKNSSEIWTFSKNLNDNVSIWKLVAIASA